MNCATLLVHQGLMAILRQPGANNVPMIVTHALNPGLVYPATPLMTSEQWITQHQDVFPFQATSTTSHQLFVLSVQLAARSAQTLHPALLALLTTT